MTPGARLTAGMAALAGAAALGAAALARARRDRACEARARRVRTADRDAVREIVETAFGGQDYVLGSFDAWVRDQDGAFWGVELENRLVAVLHVWKTDGGIAHVEGVRVHPDLRRRGLGKLLLEHAVRAARDDADLQALRYQTFTGNDASMRLAKSAGFEELVRYRFAVLSGAAFTSEPYKSLASGTSLASYLVDLESKFGPPSGEEGIITERDADSSIAALRDRCPGLPAIFQYWDAYELHEASGLFANEGVFAQVSTGLVSFGQIVEDDDPLGKLCTYTLYYSSLRPPSQAEVWAHVHRWTLLGVASSCETLALFATMPEQGQLRDQLGDVFGYERSMDILQLGVA